MSANQFLAGDSAVEGFSRFSAALNFAQFSHRRKASRRIGDFGYRSNEKTRLFRRVCLIRRRDSIGPSYLTASILVTASSPAALSKVPVTLTVLVSLQISLWKPLETSPVSL